MAEYIDREAALLEIEEWADTFCECDYVWPHVIKSIKKLPAADVRPVVYCKACRHRDPEDHKCDCGQLERAGCVFPVDDDYFCAYGER